MCSLCDDDDFEDYEMFEGVVCHNGEKCCQIQNIMLGECVRRRVLIASGGMVFGGGCMSVT